MSSSSPPPPPPSNPLSDDSIRAKSSFLETVTVRDASERDYEALRHLFEAGLLEGEVSDNDTGADIDNLQSAYFADDGQSGFWVADRGGQVIGMVGVQNQKESVAEIRRLRVHPEFRRKGVGSLLMKKSVQFCIDHGYLKVILDTRVEREPAIKMFEKLGFQHGRTREINGRRLIDFYLDMYREPEG